MADETPYVPFSQRTGLAPIPPQLKLGQVTPELRRLLYYAIHLEMDRNKKSGPHGGYFGPSWRTLALDMHVRCFKQDADTFDNDFAVVARAIKHVITSQPIGPTFDLVEFILRHHACSTDAWSEIAQAFEDARAAYRIYDGMTIVAIGTDEQAAAFDAAVREAEAKNASGARKHLIDAGVALKDGDWAGSVRESIHAVESVAVRLAPGETTLGAALKVIEKNGHLHGGLKAAFSQLYGYSSDQEGVRHALVFDDDAKVDEADALFMLGACASFVSYLLTRGSAA